MNEEQRDAILNVYDSYCDTLPHVSKLYVNLPLTSSIIAKRSLQKHKVFEKAHSKIKRWVITQANNITYVPFDKGIEYIDNPDFKVETTLRGQDIPGSVENNVFITKLYEHYFELDDIEDIRAEIEPSFIGYLDKGLIKLALRIRKVELAPGIYQTVEEVVPIFTTIYNEMLEKLIEDAKTKYKIVPTKEALTILKSKAMTAVCDREYSDGSIVKVDSIIHSLNSRLVVNWGCFKREIERYYGITWEDIYYTPQGKKVSIWGKGITTPFDNRVLIKEKTKNRLN